MNKTYILFSSFKRDIFDLVFPDGMAEHRVPLFRNFVVNGLIQLQTYCESYQLVNVGFYDKDQSFDDCGLSVIQACRGQIGAVYAFKPSCRCQRYFYDSASLEKLSCLYEACRCAQTGCSTNSLFSLSDYTRDPAYCGFNVGGNDGCRPPYLTAEPEEDGAFIASDKHFAIGPNNKLWLYPRFPCGYLIGVHWRGIKRSYLDTDYVLDDEDLKDAIAAYVESEVARRVDKDQATADKVYADYRLKAGDIIFREERDLKPRATRICVEGLDLSELVQIYPDNPYPAYVGDQCAETSLPGGGGDGGGEAEEPTFPNLPQAVACEGEQFITVIGTLPAYLSVVGDTLVMAAGHINYTAAQGGQAAANAAALAELQAYFDAAILTGTLLCGVYANTQQSISCGSGEQLSATAAIPSHYSISGDSLLIEAGHNTSEVDQAAADLEALSELTVFFNNAIISGLLVCEVPAPDPPFANLCGGWWHADSFSMADGSLVGTGASFWIDDSPSSVQRHMVQADSNKCPLFKTGIFGSRPGIFFDGINDYLTFIPQGYPPQANLVFESVGGTISQQFTMFVLYKHTAPDDSGMIMACGTSHSQLQSKGATGVMRAWDGQGTLLTSDVFATPPTTARVMVFRNHCFFPGQPFRENKINRWTTFPETQSNLGFGFSRVGINCDDLFGGAQIPFSGYIAEILVYCTTLTNEECDEVYDNFFRVKYPTVLPAVPPIAAFSGLPISGDVPLVVEFTNTSDAAHTYLWDFGDGSPTSTDENPVHGYTTIGTYTVTLTATGVDGVDVETKVGYINVWAAIAPSEDDMESYADLAALNGLNGGTGWAGAYVDRDNAYGVQSSDDMESYPDLTPLNGLNGGTGWAGAYVDR